MEDKSKPGKKLFVFGEAIALIFPVLFVLGFVGLLGLLPGPAGRKVAPPTFSDLFVEGLLAAATGYMAFSICRVKKPSFLRTAWVIAVTFLTCSLALGAFGFLCEVLFGVLYPHGWLGGTLFGVPVSIFYLLMINYKIRLVQNKLQNEKHLEENS